MDATNSLPAQLKDAVLFELPLRTNVSDFDHNDDDELAKHPYIPGKNYGVHSGKSGLVHVDLDRHNPDADGVVKFTELCGGELPETFTIKTPGNDGRHLYFWAGNSYEFGRNANLWPGVDVLGGDGYVAGPGTYRQHDGKNDVTGTYEVLKDVPIAELPSWLTVERVKERKVERAAERKAERKNNPAIERGWASQLRPQETEYERFIARLQELGLKKNPGNGNWQCPAHDDRNPSMTVTDKNGKLLAKCHADCEFEDIIAAMWPEREKTPAVELRPLVGLVVSKPHAPQKPEDYGTFLNVMSFGDLDDKPLEYRIEGLLPMGCDVLFSAYRKAGKTTTILHVIKAMSSSKSKFIGRSTETVEGKIVYVNLELTEQMLRKYADKVGLKLDNPRLLVAQLRGEASKFDILNDEFALNLALYLKSVECEVLIVDPISAVLGARGIDEWSNTLNRQVIEQLKAVAKIADVSTLIIVDHSGHADKGRSRGASAKGDTADVLWTLEKQKDGTRTLTVEGRGVEDATITFTLDEEAGELVEKEAGKLITGDNVYMTIKLNPGVNTKGLMVATGLTRQSIMAKVDMMERQHLIRVDRSPGKPNSYYPVDGV